MIEESKVVMTPTMLAEAKKSLLSQWGKKGGSKKSDKKTAASKRNIKKAQRAVRQLARQNPKE